jgi:3-dehydroquinate synthase
MIKHHSIKVKTNDRQYPILLGNGMIRFIPEWVERSIKPSKILLLTNENVKKLYGTDLLKKLNQFHPNSELFSVKDGEIHKNQKTLFSILDYLKNNKFQRDSCLLALGGGVIGDLGGLASSIYMRGISLIQVPTTLLAQVDASIGGKTAIDYGDIKNLIGTFYQPKAVFIDPLVLRTLNERNICTGMAEIIKYGIICDAELFQYLELNYEAIKRLESIPILHSILRSCEIKARIVSKDEKEKGIRAWLNYGHTLGHALEAYYQFKGITHGEAIAVGMRYASLIAHKLGICNSVTMERQSQLLQRVGLMPRLKPFDVKSVLEKMTLDKKVKGGQTQFILTRKIGLVSIQRNLPSTAIYSALKQIRAEVCESF